MKLKIFFLILFFYLNTSFAQRFSAGIAGGFVSSDLAGTDPDDNDFYKAGFSLGGIFNAKISSKNSLQFELLYTLKGSLQPPDSSNNFNYYDLSLYYIEVPLLFRHKITFNVNKKPIDKFAFETGICIGSLTKIKQSNDPYYGLPDISQYKKVELAGIIGFSYAILDNFLLDIRYSNSLIPIVKRQDNPNNLFWAYTFNKGDNMVFYFTLRYLFNSGKANDDNQ